MVNHDRYAYLSELMTVMAMAIAMVTTVEA
jgi:hypothetical protein